MGNEGRSNEGNSDAEKCNGSVLQKCVAEEKYDQVEKLTGVKCERRTDVCKGKKTGRRKETKILESDVKVL